MDRSTPRPGGWTRRQVLVAGGAVAGALAIGGIASVAVTGGRSGAPSAQPSDAVGERRRFRSRPDLVAPPILVSASTGGVAPGYVFFTPGNGRAPDGPMIVDGSGEPIWIRPPSAAAAASNLRVGSYRGSPVLTWWEGAVNGGYGIGEYLVVDGTYRTIARVRAGNGSHADLHELQLTPEGTALITAVDGALADAPKPEGAAKPTPAGGPGQAGSPGASPGGASPPTPAAGVSETPSPPASAGPRHLWQNVLQEVDVESGEVLLDWHATDHIDRSESYLPIPPPGQVYDFLHANSIDVDADGHLLLSARHTFAVYKIHRRTGEIVWRMGGRRSDFTVADGAGFSWQHDARRHPDGSMTLFDDEAAPGHSRGLTLQVDEAARTVSLARQYVHPLGLLATSQGNVQVLPNGNVFVGWGAEPYFSEFGPDGTLLYDASFPAAKMSYRAFRFDWVGRPAGRPALAVEAVRGGAVLASASWNGSTEVARWELLAGDGPEGLRTVAAADRAGFETSIGYGTRAAYAVRALDAAGRELATSEVVAVGGVTPHPSVAPGSPAA